MIWPRCTSFASSVPPAYFSPSFVVVSRNIDSNEIRRRIDPTTKRSWRVRTDVVCDRNLYMISIERTRRESSLVDFVVRDDPNESTHLVVVHVLLSLWRGQVELHRLHRVAKFEVHGEVQHDVRFEFSIIPTSRDVELESSRSHIHERYVSVSFSFSICSSSFEPSTQSRNSLHVSREQIRA